MGGAWTFDPKTRILKFSRNSFLGINGIRIMPALQYRKCHQYFMQGYVVGWAPYAPLKVWGIFQAFRDDVSSSTRGIAPWEEEDTKENGRIGQEEIGKKMEKSDGE